jgi:hypothetical protein
VHCGRRAPDQVYDYEVDRIRKGLKKSGRIFEWVDTFIADTRVTDTLFGSTKYVLFPYRNHYFSSGIFMQATQYGKAVLVPDVGLLNSYVRDHDLGLTYEHGSYVDFERKAASLGSVYRDYAENVDQFSEMFTQEQIYAHLRKGLNLAESGTVSDSEDSVGERK